MKQKIITYILFLFTLANTCTISAQVVAGSDPISMSGCCITLGDTSVQFYGDVTISNTTRVLARDSSQHIFYGANIAFEAGVRVYALHADTSLNKFIDGSGTITNVPLVAVDTLGGTFVFAGSQAQTLTNAANFNNDINTLLNVQIQNPQGVTLAGGGTRVYHNIDVDSGYLSLGANNSNLFLSQYANIVNNTNADPTTIAYVVTPVGNNGHIVKENLPANHSFPFAMATGNSHGLQTFTVSNNSGASNSYFARITSTTEASAATGGFIIPDPTSFLNTVFHVYATTPTTSTLISMQHTPDAEASISGTVDRQKLSITQQTASGLAWTERFIVPVKPDINNLFLDTLVVDIPDNTKYTAWFTKRLATNLSSLVVTDTVLSADNIAGKGFSAGDTIPLRIIVSNSSSFVYRNVVVKDTILSSYFVDIVNKNRLPNGVTLTKVLTTNKLPGTTMFAIDSSYVITWTIPVVDAATSFSEPTQLSIDVNAILAVIPGYQNGLNTAHIDSIAGDVSQTSPSFSSTVYIIQSSGQKISGNAVGNGIINTITPNGDGINDQFVIPGLMHGSTLIIQNRFGAVVYENTNYDNSWEAAGLPDGTYYYTLRMKQKDSKGIEKTELFKGWLFVIGGSVTNKQ